MKNDERKNREARKEKLPGEKKKFVAEKASPYISRGTIYGFGLCQELVEPTILPGESAICHLITMPSGTAFGLTSGTRGHLFYFHPAYSVVDVGLYSEAPVAGGSLVKIGNDLIVGGWYGEDSGGLFWHNAAFETGAGHEDFVGIKYPIERIRLPGRHEGICALAYHATTRKVFGLTKPDNKIVTIAAKTGEVRVVAQIDSAADPVLVVLPDGSLLGGCAEGELWHYRMGSPRAERTGIYIPCQAGKRYAAGMDSLLLSFSGLVYGGTSTDGYFFSYDPVARKVRNLGKPDRQSNIRALAEGHDGLIYGIAEELKGMAHLFYFDTEDRVFADLGIISTYVPVNWTAHSVGAICTGIHGEIYLGETDTLSHLFVYHPPVVAKKGKST